MSNALKIFIDANGTHAWDGDTDTIGSKNRTLYSGAVVADQLHAPCHAYRRVSLDGVNDYMTADITTPETGEYTMIAAIRNVAGVTDGGIAKSFQTVASSDDEISVSIKDTNVIRINAREGGSELYDVSLSRDTSGDDVIVLMFTNSATAANRKIVVNAVDYSSELPATDNVSGISQRYFSNGHSLTEGFLNEDILFGAMISGTVSTSDMIDVTNILMRNLADPTYEGGALCGRMESAQTTGLTAGSTVVLDKFRGVNMLAGQEGIIGEAGRNYWFTGAGSGALGSTSSIAQYAANDSSGRVGSLGNCYPAGYSTNDFNATSGFGGLWSPSTDDELKLTLESVTGSTTNHYASSCHLTVQEIKAGYSAAFVMGQAASVGTANDTPIDWDTASLVTVGSKLTVDATTKRFKLTEALGVGRGLLVICGCGSNQGTDNYARFQIYNTTDAAYEGVQAIMRDNTSGSSASSGNNIYHHMQPSGTIEFNLQKIDGNGEPMNSDLMWMMVIEVDNADILQLTRATTQSGTWNVGTKVNWDVTAGDMTSIWDNTSKQITHTADETHLVMMSGAGQSSGGTYGSFSMYDVTNSVDLVTETGQMIFWNGTPTGSGGQYPCSATVLTPSSTLDTELRLRAENTFTAFQHQYSTQVVQKVTPTAASGGGGNPSPFGLVFDTLLTASPLSALPLSDDNMRGSHGN